VLGDYFTPGQGIVVGDGGRRIVTHDTPRVALQHASAEAGSLLLVVSALGRRGSAPLVILQQVLGTFAAAFHGSPAAVATWAWGLENGLYLSRLAAGWPWGT
jgi:hypothetical protein